MLPMDRGHSLKLTSIITILYLAIAILLARVFVSILFGFADYFPPNFRSGFLTGRDEYFFGIYQYAFYSHIFLGPLSILLGTLLFFQGNGLLEFKSNVHRMTGKVQAAVVLLGVVPSGLIMASPNFIGLSAGSSLIALAIATAFAMTIAVVYAKQKQLDMHQVWATRCYILLISPLLLRVLTGLLLILEIRSDRILDTISWISWIVPLFIFELHRLASEKNWNPLKTFLVKEAQT